MLKKLRLRQKKKMIFLKKRKRVVAQSYFVDFFVLLMSFEGTLKNAPYFFKFQGNSYCKT